MEKLAALCCLWVFGFGTKAEYSAELDRLFLEEPKTIFCWSLKISEMTARRLGKRYHLLLKAR